MTNSPAVHSLGDIIESVIAKGDLAKLSPEERTRYYVEVCKSVGLNPLTKPFEYITLNGKLQLYALKGATDQLRTIHAISVDEMAESERGGVFIVTCKVHNKDGRTDMAKGAVPLGDLKGEALANAIMKCETKAKRRATLSICGLGMLDESEVDSLPSAVPLTSQNVPERVPEQPLLGPKVKPLPPKPPSNFNEVYDPETGEIEGVKPHAIQPQGNWVDWGTRFVAEISGTKNRRTAEAWVAANEASLAKCEEEHPKVFRRLAANITAMREKLEDEIPADFMQAQ